MWDNGYMEMRLEDIWGLMRVDYLFGLLYATEYLHLECSLSIGHEHLCKEFLRLYCNKGKKYSRIHNEVYHSISPCELRFTSG